MMSFMRGEALVKPMLALLCGLTVAAVAVSGTAAVSPADGWSLEVVPVTSPAAANSAQPQLSALGSRVVLSWLERSGDNASLRFSDRTDTGWSEPRTVASGTNWFVNWADVPS